MSQPTTPRKVYVRTTGQCRLCKCTYEKNRQSNVFSKKGIERQYIYKIKCLFGIDINKYDSAEPIICRSCVNKVNTFWEYRQTCLQKENEVVCVKRGVSLTFNSEDFANPTNSEFPDTDKYCSELCVRKGHKSALHEHSVDAMCNLKLEKLWNEVKQIPHFVNLLSAVSGKEPDEPGMKLKFISIYSILMFSRWHELSYFQRVNSVMAIQGGASKKMQQRLHKLGICLSYSSRDLLLKIIGGHFLDEVIDDIKSGHTYRGTGDNWDMRILKSHMRSNVNNSDLHLFASNLIQNRVNFDHLPNLNPVRNIKTVERSVFSPSVNELKTYSENSKILIGRIAVENLKSFGFLKKILPKHIQHKYTQQMSQQSNIVSLPIIDANEANYNDCVKILRTYEAWITEIFLKAGYTKTIDAPENPALPNDLQSNPGQTHAHVFHPEEDMDFKICFSGDQLTRVRFAGAKDLLAGAHTATDCFEHCSPFKPVMWHTKASFLQLCYHLLFDQNSIDQVGTLKFFREKYNRKNSTPSKVLDSYEGSEELFVSAGKAYIVAALMNFFGMKHVDDEIHQHKPDSNQDKLEYFNNVFGEFTDKYVLQKNFVNDDDNMLNYSYCFIFCVTLLLNLIDTAAEGDGERNLINQKLLLSVFKSLQPYSKYAIEMFTSIAQIECLLTPRLSEQFKWGFFVNWRGGIGNNIEEDLAQEISNRISKNIVQKMGSNKSIQSISKTCKAVNDIKKIVENYDFEIGIKEGSSHHTTRSSANDEKNMVSDILTIDPFGYKPGRSHDSFKDIKRSPMRYINIVNFHQWLEKQRSFLS